MSDRYSACDKDLGAFSECDQELIGLCNFNSEYGANYLSSYFNWHGLELYEPTIRGLKRIGAHELCATFEKLIAWLREREYPFGDIGIDYWVGDLGDDVHDEMTAFDTAADNLYEDFFERWGARVQVRRGRWRACR